MTSTYNIIVENFIKRIKFEEEKKDLFESINSLKEFVEKRIPSNVLKESVDGDDKFDKAFFYSQTDKIIKAYNDGDVDGVYEVLFDEKFRKQVLSIFHIYLFCIAKENLTGIDFFIEDQSDSFAYSYTKREPLGPAKTIQEFKSYILPPYFKQFPKNILWIIKIKYFDDNKNLENFNFYIKNIFPKYLKIVIKKDNTNLTFTQINKDAEGEIISVNQFSNVLQNKEYEKTLSELYNKNENLKLRINSFLSKNYGLDNIL